MKDSFFRKSIKNYKWRSIFLRHLITIFIILAIPVITVSLCFVIYYNQSTDKTITTEANFAISNISDTFNQSQKNVYQIYTTFLSDVHIKNYLFTEENIFSPTILNETNEIMSAMQSYTNTIDELYSIYIYNKKTGYVLSTRSPSYINDFHDTLWYDKFKENNYQNTEFSHTANSIAMYTIVKNIYIDNIDCGIIVFNIDINSFYNSLTSQSSDINNLFVINEDNKILISRNFNILYSDFNDKLMSHCDENTVYRTNIENYSVICEITNPKFSDMTYFSTLIFVVFFLVLAGIFISSYFFSANYYRDFIEILSILNDDQDQNTDYQHNEIEYIQSNLHKMKSKNQQIEHQLENNMKALRKSQLYTLQQQINPHFIFNTLNLIVTIDQMKNKTQTETQKIILLLSDILHFNFKNPSYIISFEDELKYLKKYIELQNIRYENKFNFNCSIPEHILKTPVLKFMLQPLVENSIKHGILKTESMRGTITLDANTVDDKLYVKITDDGVGIAKERLKLLSRFLTLNQKSNDFIGLCNVNSRIKLVFGDMYGVSVKSDQNGTEVLIILPYNNKGELFS